ncbi:DUF4268 domain-containing protein [Neogemmobacter tilapiae]|nr:DUF4268 domain-containing protein [Gemmobacter tilapiae]
MRLGKIETVDIRTVSRNEAGDFTPWLAQDDNRSALGEALHLGELTLQSTELSVGDFSADIVAVDEGGAQVLIENQLEPTDHRHLGQVLTYLAGLANNEASIVWVATRFREEHRAAIDWLNRSTIDGYDFFGVEIELLRIGDSDPAPRFNVVAMPNDWARQARQAVRRASSEALSETGALYQEYWLAMRDVAEASGEKQRFPKAWPRQWLPFRIGRTGFQMSAVANRTGKSLRVELYMRQKGMPPNQAFNALMAQRGAIDAAYGGVLDWQALPDSVAARIAVHLPNADVADRGDWPRQHAWIVAELAKFRRVFADRVKALRLDEIPGADDADADPDEMA